MPIVYLYCPTIDAYFVRGSSRLKLDVVDLARRHVFALCYVHIT